MKLRGLLFLLLLVVCAVEEIRGKRTSGGRRPSPKVSGNYGSHHGTSHGTSHSNSGTSHSTSHSNSGTTTHHEPKSTQQQNKDVSTSFLHAEGGGATRPAQSPHPSTFGGSHSPSAPPAQPSGHTPSGPYSPSGSPYSPSGSPYSPNGSPYPSSGSPYGPFPSHEPGKPRIDKDPMQTSPHAPSAPTSFGQPGTPYRPGQNAPWSNPHLGPNQPAAPNPQAPHIGFKEHLNTPSSAPGLNSPHPNAPYPVQHGSGPFNPTHGGNAPYPVQGSGAPYPTHGGNPSYPVQHGYNPSYPVGGQSFGNPSYQPSAPIMPGQNNFNSFGHPSQPPMGNPYSTNYAGGGQMGPGPYSPPPQMMSQPAAQPYVPGHTVIMMPGQQDSGRGLGQIFKEALVFSTVNAAVNRVINPHTHHVIESKPAESSGGSAAPTTHVTYNNQYFNTYPGANGTDGASVPPGTPGVPPVNPVSGPSAGGTSVPSASESTNVTGVPSVNPVSSGVPAGTAAAGPGMVPGPPSIQATQAPQTPQATEENGNATTVQDNPATYVPTYTVSDDDLMKISEELFESQAVNVSKYVTLNLQNRSTSQFPNITDEAEEPLFLVEPEVLEYPTILVTRALYDNYEFDSEKKETHTMEQRMKENLLIDTFLETNVMSRAMQWLADHSFVDPDDFERKDTLRHVWFHQFSGSTSGFERIFTAEKYGGTDILGVQDWLYFEYKEAKKELEYMGYVDKLDLGSNAALVKLNFQMDGIIRPNATIFVGTLPELEMSLYTICFYARPNNLCPVSLGGVKFNIFTHSFRYYGNDLIDLGMPMF